jgi:hypothetical protein
MTIRTATCQCGALTARCEGEPVRVSACHCLECQRRSGSAFAVQARFRAEQVTTHGDTGTWSRTGDDGTTAHFRFCPTCGSTVFYLMEAEPDLIAVAVGAFADPDFPAPTRSVYEGRRHGWTGIFGENVERWD